MTDLATVLLIASACCGLLYLCDEWRLRRSAKRIQDAEDLAAANEVMDSWKPKPRWSHRDRFGRYKKTYGHFTPSIKL